MWFYLHVCCKKTCLFNPIQSFLSPRLWLGDPSSPAASWISFFLTISNSQIHEGKGPECGEICLRLREGIKLKIPQELLHKGMKSREHSRVLLEEVQSDFHEAKLWLLVAVWCGRLATFKAEGLSQCIYFGCHHYHCIGLAQPESHVVLLIPSCISSMRPDPCVVTVILLIHLAEIKMSACFVNSRTLTVSYIKVSFPNQDWPMW